MILKWPCNLGTELIVSSVHHTCPLTPGPQIPGLNICFQWEIEVRRGYSLFHIINWCEFSHVLLSIHKGIFYTLIGVGDGIRGSWTDEHVSLYLEVNVCCHFCDQTKSASLMLDFLRQTACFKLLPGLWTCHWKNHFGITVTVVRGAPYKVSQMIYTFHIYKKMPFSIADLWQSPWAILNSILQTWEANLVSTKWVLLNIIEDYPW